MDTGESRGTWKPTLRLSIRVVLAGMILLTAAIITLTSYLASRSALLGFSRELVDKSAEMVRLQVTGYMTPAKQAAELALSLALDRTVRVEDLPTVERYFFDYLSVHETMSMLNYGDETGDFLMVKRMPDRSLSTKIITHRQGMALGDARRVLWRHRRPGAAFGEIVREETDPADPYDPRIRPWYEGAKRDRGPHWTEVYVFHSDRQPGITAAVPLYRPEGGLRGVLSVDIGLWDVSRFLEEKIRVGESGQAFLLDRGGRMIASRQVEALTIADEKAGARLRKLAESPRPELAALAGVPAFTARFEALYYDRSPASPAASQPVSRSTGQDGSRRRRRTVLIEERPRDVSGGRPSTGAEGGAQVGAKVSVKSGAASAIRYTVGGVDYIAKVEPIDVGGRRWLVGVVAAEDEFLAEAKRANVRNAITAGVLTLAALALGGLVGTFIVRSLGLLVRETERLQRLEFADEGPASSRFHEVDQVLEAFDRMKTGLRAFGKYVPMTLVRRLLEERVEARLGAATKDLTLFFSDIRDFTTKSERMSPTELAEWLSRYLSSVTECIHAHKGTVDKYMGDGVMAFWGAPADVPDHAAAACSAALECARRVEELGREAPGEMDFFTRIGIHTAAVAVGNFGSTDRLNYTAMGDGVNLGSRLEGTNKVFGTQIMISEDTYARVQGRFETRKLGLVAVKGRGAACAVYELIAEKGAADGTRLARARRYEEALELYFSRKWDGALALLDRLMRDEPDDRSYAFLAGACRAFEEGEPPPADWDGVFTMTTK